MEQRWRIRKAEADDAGGIYDVLVDSVRGLTGGEYTPEQQRAWIGSCGRDFLHSMVALEQHDIWVAEAAGAGIVAFGALHADEVSYLYVRTRYVGQGLGTRLLLLMEETARRKGERRLRLHSSLTARAFYERRGFTATGRIMVCRQGVYLPVVLMEKALQ